MLIECQGMHIVLMNGYLIMTMMVVPVVAAHRMKIAIVAVESRHKKARMATGLE